MEKVCCTTNIFHIYMRLADVPSCPDRQRHPELCVQAFQSVFDDIPLSQHVGMHAVGESLHYQCSISVPREGCHLPSQPQDVKQRLSPHLPEELQLFIPPCDPDIQIAPPVLHHWVLLVLVI